MALSLELMRSRGHQNIWWVTQQTKGSLEQADSYPGLTHNGRGLAKLCPAQPEMFDPEAVTHTLPTQKGLRGRQRGKGDRKAGVSTPCSATSYPYLSALPRLLPF